MASGLYLRPRGLVQGSAAAAAVKTGKALPLAGGPAAFSLVEVIEGAPGAITSQFSSPADLAASGERAIRSRLERLTAPRAPLCGLDLDRTRLMGVVNVTPDSFSDGGLHDTAEAAIAHGTALAAEGADILDIGGESTRPGAEPVEAAEEAARILPVMRGLQGAGAVLSADTRKAAVMEGAAQAGAGLLNDVSALTHDPDSLAVAAGTECAIVLMHAQGDPKTMQDNPSYKDVVLEVFDYLEARIAACEAAGIPRARLVVDPGIGFGKTLQHNLAILGSISLLHGLGVPVLVGASRKSFIGTLTGESDPRARLSGSIAAALAAVAGGVQLMRVHDVGETRRALTVWQAAVTGEKPALV